jgi:hypothetical protein
LYKNVFVKLNFSGGYMHKFNLILLAAFIFFLTIPVTAQEENEEKDKDKEKNGDGNGSLMIWISV